MLQNRTLIKDKISFFLNYWWGQLSVCDIPWFQQNYELSQSISYQKLFFILEQKKVQVSAFNLVKKFEVKYWEWLPKIVTGQNRIKTKLCAWQSPHLPCWLAPRCHLLPYFFYFAVLLDRLGRPSKDPLLKNQLVQVRSWFWSFVLKKFKKIWYFERCLCS